MSSLFRPARYIQDYSTPYVQVRPHTELRRPFRRPIYALPIVDAEGVDFSLR